MTCALVHDWQSQVSFAQWGNCNTAALKATAFRGKAYMCFSFPLWNENFWLSLSFCVWLIMNYFHRQINIQFKLYVESIFIMPMEKGCNSMLFDYDIWSTKQCHFGMVNFLQNTGTRYPKACPHIWGVLCEFIVWFMFNISHCIAVFNTLF